MASLGNCWRIAKSIGNSNFFHRLNSQTHWDFSKTRYSTRLLKWIPNVLVITTTYAECAEAWTVRKQMIQIFKFVHFYKISFIELLHCTLIYICLFFIKCFSHRLMLGTWVCFVDQLFNFELVRAKVKSGHLWITREHRVKNKCIGLINSYI